MKNSFKLFRTRSTLCTPSRWLCAIALVAVIGLLMTGCPNPAGAGFSGGGGGEDDVGVYENYGDYTCRINGSNITIIKYNHYQI